MSGQGVKCQRSASQHGPFESTATLVHWMLSGTLWPGHTNYHILHSFSIWSLASAFPPLSQKESQLCAHVYMNVDYSWLALNWSSWCGQQYDHRFIAIWSTCHSCIVWLDSHFGSLYNPAPLGLTNQCWGDNVILGHREQNVALRYWLVANA